VLEHDDLVRVRVAPDEQQVEYADSALALELGQLVGDAALEVRARVEADVEELDGPISVIARFLQFR
jgi:hypothetical protein